MRMKHLWDQEQRINKAWNYSWVQWRDVDWHGPRRGHTQTCSLTHTHTHTHTHTLLSLPRDVQLMCVWMPSEQLQILSSPCQVCSHQLLSLLPLRLLTFCRVFVPSQPFTSNSPYTTHSLSLSLSLHPPLPSLSRRITAPAVIILCEEKQPSLSKPSCCRSCRRALRQSVGNGPTGPHVALQFSVFLMVSCNAVLVI